VGEGLGALALQKGSIPAPVDFRPSGLLLLRRKRMTHGRTLGVVVEIERRPVYGMSDGEQLKTGAMEILSESASLKRLVKFGEVTIASLLDLTTRVDKLQGLMF